MQSMADHISPVLSILGVVFGLLMAAIGFIMFRVWKNIDKLNDKVDEFLKAHYECQRSLPMTYMAKIEFHEFIVEWRAFLVKRENDWKELWGAFNYHTHEGSPGPVVRKP
jgi:CDP-diglyceride synthetase